MEWVYMCYYVILRGNFLHYSEYNIELWRDFKINYGI